MNLHLPPHEIRDKLVQAPSHPHDCHLWIRFRGLAICAPDHTNWSSYITLWLCSRISHSFNLPIFPSSSARCASPFISFSALDLFTWVYEKSSFPPFRYPFPRLTYRDNTYHIQCTRHDPKITISLAIAYSCHLPSLFFFHFILYNWVWFITSV